MGKNHDWGTPHQTDSSKYLETMRGIYVPAVNEPEPWRAVRWGSQELQIKRLDVLAELLLEPNALEYELEYESKYGSVLDVGCGTGEFFRYFGTSGYHGIDIVPEMIEVAAIRWGTGVRFEVHDLRDEPRPADAVVASGLFSVSNDEIFWSMLDAMWESARNVMAFNCKSSWAPKELEGISVGGDIGYFRDPADTLALCRERYSSNIVLRHDYLDHDFTLALYK